MTISKWQPFGDLLSIHNRINKLFEDRFMKDSEYSEDTLSCWFPLTDIFETKDEYVIKLEVPGMAKEDINIEFHNNTLSVKGERKEDKDVKKEDYHRIESYCGTFSRSFSIPQDVEPNKIKAEMKDGVLVLKIPKVEMKKATPIKINAK